MKVSEIFNLKKTQHELDFVDIDPTKDKPVFIDPFFISTRQHSWCLDTSRTIRNFFQYAIDLIKAGKIEEARSIFINLNEPNETCFGMSKSLPQGRGVGSDDSRRIFESILESEAVVTGVVEDLEDTAIFIEGISRDKVSDMTTNIIKKHLTEYTQAQCRLWDIPLQQGVPTGFYWDAAQKDWDNVYTERLVVDGKPLLLVPKIAVSFYREYIDKKYYQHYVLNFLQNDHLQRQTALVRRRFNKRGQLVKEWVTKKDIQESEAPFSKEFLRDFTKKHPEVFQKFRSTKSKTVSPVENSELEHINISELVDFLIGSLQAIEPGPEEAGKYHKLIIGILELIFYPNLTNPVKEREINDGRKRIDITFDNAAPGGFFHSLHDIHKITSRYIFIECKNYSDDPKNPELDQLAGRFSVNSSNFGILVCRKVDDKELFIKRCRDLWKQKNELIIPLTDDDIIEMLKDIKSNKKHPEEKILTNLQREVILA